MSRLPRKTRRISTDRAASGKPQAAEITSRVRAPCSTRPQWGSPSIKIIINLLSELPKIRCFHMTYVKTTNTFASLQGFLYDEAFTSKLVQAASQSPSGAMQRANHLSHHMSLQTSKWGLISTMSKVTSWARLSSRSGNPFHLRLARQCSDVQHKGLPYMSRVKRKVPSHEPRHKMAVRS